MSNPALNILIVEDDFLVSEMINGLIAELGHQVVGVASNGQEAITLTQSLSPDILLMDVDMPVMNGIAAARRIQSLHPTPIVMLTAYESSELVQQASAVGAGAYLLKPPKAQEIERAITIAMARFNDWLTLRRLNQQLEERNQELDAFAHTVAHNLQNTLSRLIGYAELLQLDFGILSAEERQRYLETIVSNGHKMSAIVDELLLLANVRKAEVTILTFYMEPVVNEALERLEEKIEQAKATIIKTDSWPLVMGYPPWIEEVWDNYISNALKYGGANPQIELGFDEVDEHMVRFWVKDQGKGLTEEEQAQLFKPFTQLSQDKKEGHGLGLSIVFRILEKLSGQVGVESTVGQGSLFWFSLPKPIRLN